MPDVLKVDSFLNSKASGDRFQRISTPLTPEQVQDVKSRYDLSSATYVDSSYDDGSIVRLWSLPVQGIDSTTFSLKEIVSNPNNNPTLTNQLVKSVK